MFEYLQQISDWLQNGIYGWFSEAVGYLIASLITLWFKLQLQVLTFAWGVAKSILSNLGVNTLLQNAWNVLPGEVLAEMKFFKIPESINLLLTGVVTRMVLKFVPGL
ncbi:MAG TPA: DUF2523 family protein [Rhodocyclaceae bacterium]|nr:DUF2523 family protein [Rhodocyclaceae bacterium]